MGIAGSVAVATALLCTIAQVFAAEQKYGPGVTDTEIKIGQTIPYSGPASAYSTVGVTQAAYFIVATPKAAAQAIRGAHEFDWHPARFLVNVASSVGAVLKPAGLEAAKGIVSAAYQKDPNDPQWKDDPAVKDWNAWIDRYLPRADKTDFLNVYGYNSAQTLVEVLKRRGDDPTRENVMKQATSLNTTLPMLLPGVKLSMSPTDLRPMKQTWLQRFDGERWRLFGDVVDVTK